MSYGDELFAQEKICEENEALVQYQNAQTIAALDKVAQKNYDQAMLICHPPTETPTLITVTPTPATPYP
jgi:NADPH-dependent glutamate synthase beta subunit-like oxidoreductase